MYVCMYVCIPEDLVGIMPKTNHHHGPMRKSKRRHYHKQSPKISKHASLTTEKKETIVEIFFINLQKYSPQNELLNSRFILVHVQKLESDIKQLIN